MATPLLSIIIVSRNRSSELQRCLQSLTKLTCLSYEIVVIDNDSSDGLSEMVGEDFPYVRLFRADRNYGCGVGRNIGARVAKGDYFWFIDDDAEVVVADAGERLIDKLVAEPDVAGIGGEAVVDQMNRIIGVKQLDLAHNGMTTGRYTLSVADDQWLEVRLLAGCNVIVRRADFIAFGGFDPSFRHGWEDTDFAWRLHKSGNRLLVAGFAPVLHHFSGVERQNSLKTPAQSRAYFVAKNSSWLVLLFLPLFDLAYLLDPRRWLRIVDKARRIDYGAKGRVTRPSGRASPVDARQLRGAVKVALNYAATVAGGYAFGWRMFGKGLAARKHAPDGWEAADPIIIKQHVYDPRTIAAAE